MRNIDRLLGPNRAGLYITAIIIIEIEGLTKRILEDLLKDKVASEIREDVNSHDLFRKTDLRLLTF